MTKTSHHSSHFCEKSPHLYERIQHVIVSLSAKQCHSCPSGDKWPIISFPQTHTCSTSGWNESLKLCVHMLTRVSTDVVAWALAQISTPGLTIRNMHTQHSERFLVSTGRSTHVNWINRQSLGVRRRIGLIMMLLWTTSSADTTSNQTQVEYCVKIPHDRFTTFIWNHFI